MVALTACSVVARCSTGAFLQRASARSDGIAHGSTPPPEPGEREATTPTHQPVVEDELEAEGHDRCERDFQHSPSPITETARP